MAFADSNRVSLAYIAEITAGTTPGSGNGAYLRITGESLDYTINTTISNEMRSDRQVSDLIPTDASTTGGFNFEWIYGAFDTLIAAALCSTFSADLAIVGIAGDISSVASGQHLTSTLSTKFNAVVVGQVIQTSGWTGANNNGLWIVLTKASGQDITLQSLAGSTVLLTDETPATTAAHIKGSMIRNGVTKTSFTFEKNFVDVTQFIDYTGSYVDTMTFTVKAGSVITGSFGIMGFKGARYAVTQLPGSTTAVNANQVESAVANVLSINDGGDISTQSFTELTLNLKNNCRKQPAIGSLNVVGIGFGQFEVSGTVTLYFATGAEYDKYLAQTATSIRFETKDSGGNKTVWSLPQLKFQTGKVVAGGKNQDVMATFTFSSIVDPTTGCMMQIDKVAGP